MSRGGCFWHVLSMSMNFLWVHLLILDRGHTLSSPTMVDHRSWRTTHHRSWWSMMDYAPPAWAIGPLLGAALTSMSNRNTVGAALTTPRSSEHEHSGHLCPLMGPFLKLTNLSFRTRTRNLLIRSQMRVPKPKLQDSNPQSSNQKSYIIIYTLLDLDFGTSKNMDIFRIGSWKCHSL